ncbi:MAG: glycosyltransferase family 4 protein [Aquificae bacterium]|nr:glycosyltransferase family 4 protein [Aquificota bacterium]
MKIGAFLPLWTENLTGIGRYTYQLLKSLSKYKEYEIILISNKKLKFNVKNVKVVYEKNRILRRLPPNAWFRYFSWRYINKLSLKYIWSGVPVTPIFVNSNTQKVIVVYDFNLYIVPETMHIKTKLSYKLFFKKAIKEADKIITISAGTDQKLQRYFNKKADAIIRPGVDTQIFNPYKSENERPFNFKYILTVSTIEPRKNISSLIRAFLDLKKEELFKDIKLVIAGNTGWKSKEVHYLIENNKSEIVYLQYVSDIKLAQLYRWAEVFIFPSIYEGFGMPVLEARNCGCCVITTDIPELKEACGEGCIYIKPDKESIKKALKDFFYKKLKCQYKGYYTIDWEEEAKKLRKIFT